MATTWKAGVDVDGHFAIRWKALVTRLLSNRWFKRCGGLIVALLLIVMACASYFRIWSWRDLQVYRMMREECHPVWKDLHWGRIHSGQDVEEVIAITQPVRVQRYGEFVQLSYQESLSFTGVTILAKNGRLASAIAWSCTWNRVFFNELTEQDETAFSIAYETHWQPIRKKWEEAQKGAAPEGDGM